MSQSNSFEDLIQTGNAHLQKAEYMDAARELNQALEIREDIYTRNNLTLCYYYMQQAETGLKVLQANLLTSDEQPFHHPFSHSLAAILLHSLGRGDEAGQHLRLAISGYSEGSEILSEAGLPFDSVGAYLSIMMQAAGELGMHGLVLELFNKWKKDYVSWECFHNAAVAAFNLGEYKAAAALWSVISQQVPLCESMPQIAAMVGSGLIPAFAMEYRAVSKQELYRQLQAALGNAEAEQRFIDQGNARMALLGYIWSNDSVINPESAFAVVNALIAWSGPWGQDLGHRLLRNDALNPVIRRATAECMLEIGAMTSDELFDLEIEDDKQDINLELLQVSYSSEMESLYEEAWSLIERGDVETALQMWETKFETEGKLYPPAMLSMVEIYLGTERFDDAAFMLDLLDKVNQAEQGVFHNDICFNRAFLAYFQSNAAEAWHYLNSINVESLSEEEHSRLLAFRERLSESTGDDLPVSERSSSLGGASDRYGEIKRLEIEDKPLPLNASLARGMKNMPAGWVEAICLNLGIIASSKRKEREQQIIGQLLDPDFLGRLIRSLDEKQRQTMSYLLANGGYAAIGALRTRFGGLDGESFDWLEEGTSTALGTLWSLALVMVGKAELDGERSKYVIIPMELRSLLPDIPGLGPVH